MLSRSSMWPLTGAARSGNADSSRWRRSDRHRLRRDAIRAGTGGHRGGRVDAFGRLDGAVNNAGVSGTLAFSADMAEEDWQHTLDVNLSGVFRCLKYELQQMMAQEGGGAIVNTASAAGLIGLPRAVAYAASKHGVIGITRTAALEYARRRIRVNAVCPGFVETAMVDIWDEMRPGMLDGVRRFNPMRRLGQPDEVAAAIVWLLSDEASFVNGHTLSVDGGVTAQ